MGNFRYIHILILYKVFEHFKKFYLKFITNKYYNITRFHSTYKLYLNYSRISTHIIDKNKTYLGLVNVIIISYHYVIGSNNQE